jgi:hypothetical protein
MAANSVIFISKLFKTRGFQTARINANSSGSRKIAEIFGAGKGFWNYARILEAEKNRRKYDIHG